MEACEACGGEVVSLGVLGRTLHVRCRACGLTEARELSAEELAELQEQQSDE